MGFFTRMMSYLTLGSSRPIRRLAAYYALLAIAGLVVFHFFPVLDGLLTGDRLNTLRRPRRHCCATAFPPPSHKHRRLISWRAPRSA